MGNEKAECILDTGVILILGGFYAEVALQEEEKERSLIEDLKRHTQLTVAWRRCIWLRCVTVYNDISRGIPNSLSRGAGTGL